MKMNIDLEFTSSPVHLAQVPTENPYAGDYYAYYGGVINGFYRVLEYMNNTGAAGYPIPGTTINGSSPERVSPSRLEAIEPGPDG